MGELRGAWQTVTMAVRSSAISRVPVTSRKMMKMLISLSRDCSSHMII